MKKFIVGTIAAVLMASGFVAVSEVTASAAPYPGTVRTRTIAAGIAPDAPRQAKLFVKVNSFQQGRPSGALRITMINKGSGKSYEFSRGYDGPDRYTFWGLQPGRYRVVVSFLPPNESKFKPSTATAFARVRR